MGVKIRLRTLFVFCMLTGGAFCTIVGKKDARTDTLIEGPGKRTFIVSKLFLIPTLATIGLKFLLLLPVFLSKIALLGVMNFVASNLSLLMSAAMGVKNYFTGDNLQWQATPQFEDHRFTQLNYLNPDPIQFGQKFEFLQDGNLHRDGIYRSLSRSKKTQGERHLYKVPENQLNQESLRYTELNSDANALGKYQCRWVKETEEDVFRKYYTPNNPSLLPSGFTPSAVNDSNLNLAQNSYPVDAKDIVFKDDLMSSDSTNLNSQTSNYADNKTWSINLGMAEKDAIVNALRRKYYATRSVDDRKEPDGYVLSSATQIIFTSPDTTKTNDLSRNSKNFNQVKTVHPFTVRPDSPNLDSLNSGKIHREKRDYQKGVLRCKRYDANNIEKSDSKLYNVIRKPAFKTAPQTLKVYNVKGRIRSPLNSIRK